MIVTVPCEENPVCLGYDGEFLKLSDGSVQLLFEGRSVGGLDVDAFDGG